MAKLQPKIIVLSGYGLNCEDETKLAFELAGGVADIAHINELTERPNLLNRYQILAVPGGFSFGDDTGSGLAYANKLKNHLHDELKKFASRDKLILGICNGFQILTNAGLLPGALTFNDNARYTNRWVDIKTANLQKPHSPWLKSISQFPLPIAHGEGKFIAEKSTLNTLKQNGQIAFVYTKGEACTYQNLPANPNGSTLDIAGITDHSGKILGIMPHPERAMFFTQLPFWPVLKEKLIRDGKPLPKFGPGLQIFKNGIKYFYD